MFNKQQINALWAKINAKYGPTNASPTHKSSSVSELQTMISEGTLIPGTVYSYDVGTEENSVTIYQKAITPDTLDTNGILVSDDDKYNGVDVEFDVTKCPTDTSLLVIMSSDKSNLHIYQNGELSDVAANIGLTELGDTIFKRIPKNDIPKTLNAGVYLVRVQEGNGGPDENPVVYYGGLALIENSGSNRTLHILVDSKYKVWTIIDNKFTTNSANKDEIAAFINDVLRQIYQMNDDTFVMNNGSFKQVSLSEIPVVISIIDPEYTGA